MFNLRVMPALFVSLLAFCVLSPAADWAQWGGPNRDFKSAEKGLSASWPAGGPRVLWKRELGEGYSAILASGKTLYTMYRSGDVEHVTALDADSGAPRWDHAYPAPLQAKGDSKYDTNFGRGPNATPLLVGERLVTVGFTGRLHCLNAADGKVLWERDLLTDLGATFLEFGYSASPLHYKDSIILPIGAKGRSVVALSLADGKERWSSGDFANSYSSPILVDVGPQRHIALVMTKEIIGVNADDGKLAWTHPYINQWDCHCTTPVDCGDGRVFFPSFNGGVMLELAYSPAGTHARELWTSKKIGVGQANVVCIGDYLYGASGSGRASFFAAVGVKDGGEAWRERLPLANVVYADGRLIALDEGGTLSMLKASPEKFESVAKAPVLEAKVWTAPTLADGRLYIRDQKSIAALVLTD